jgi:hypothetical protein
MIIIGQKRVDFYQTKIFFIILGYLNVGVTESVKGDGLL